MKKVLKPYTFKVTSLSASFESEATSIEYLDRVLLHIACTGTPEGTLTVQGSVDFDGASPTWVDLPLSLTALTGGPEEYFIDINQTAIRALRLKFVKTAGTGSITAKISAKES